MKKKLYIGSNLKMYKTVSETVRYLQRLEENTKEIDKDQVQLFILPSYTSLAAATEAADTERIRIGAQNMSWADEGQFTGEISPVMLEETGADLVMIGHSERRHVFGETDREENQKVKAALSHGITPLLCIGETAGQKEDGISEEILRIQIKRGLRGVSEEQLGNVWVAYEPVWSIGVDGTPATADYAEKMHKAIKKVLVELYQEAAGQIPVLYGGSVNAENAKELIVQESIDGLFVGRAAWDADQFRILIQNALEAAQKKLEAEKKGVEER